MKIKSWLMFFIIAISFITPSIASPSDKLGPIKVFKIVGKTAVAYKSYDRKYRDFQIEAVIESKRNYRNHYKMKFIFDSEKKRDEKFEKIEELINPKLFLQIREMLIDNNETEAIIEFEN